MKNKGLFLIFALAIVFTACKKDESKDANESLEGSWKATSIKINGGEVLGDSAIFQSYEMTFKSTGDYNGTVDINAVIFEENDTKSISYKINEEDAKKMTWTDEDGDTEWAMDLSDTQIKISGIDVDGNQQEMIASKK